MALKDWIRDRLKGGADVYRLEAEVRALRALVMERIEAAGPRPAGIAYDLVRLGNAGFFVPSRDNLYIIAIPEDCRHHTMAAHRAVMTEPGYGPDILRQDVTKLLFAYLDTLFRAGQAVALYDVGAWVGDVAIRLAVFARQRGARFTADCFDPSLAGTLIPFNIELNGVADLVRYRPVGVSVSGGPAVFTQLHGHSDSARLESIGTGDMAADWYVIRTVTLGECLRPPQPGVHEFVKIDVEGIDAALVRQHRRRLDHASLAIEFAPNQAQYADIGAVAFVADLMTTHSLIDLFYLPRPTMAEPVRDAASFVETIRQRQYGYTDILAIPRSLTCHDALLAMAQGMTPIAPEYRLA